jgi:hypothetical protein
MRASTEEVGEEEEEEEGMMRGISATSRKGNGYERRTRVKVD